MGSGKAGLILLLGVGIGLGLGVTLGGSTGSSSPSSSSKSPREGQALAAVSPGAVASPEAREKKIAELESQVEQLATALRKNEDSRTSPKSEKPGSGSGSGSAARSSEKKAASGGAMSAAEAAARLKKMEGEVDAAIAGKDWKAVFLLLKDLRKTLPQAGEAGWPLVVKVGSALWAQAESGDLPREVYRSFYRVTSGEEFSPLYMKALEDAKTYDSTFRKLAVEGLSSGEGEGTDALFLKCLATETDEKVAEYMASSLQGVDAEHVPALLAAIRSQQSTQVRQALVYSLTQVEGAEATRALSQVAASEADPGIKQIAQGALQMRTAPVTGYYVTMVYPQSQAEAAGMKTGDILTAYNGTPVSNMSQLMAAKKTVPDGAAVVVSIYREGAILSLPLKSGQMGINGQFVSPPNEPGK